jgi:CDGSH-type Zn-finger protein
MHPNGPNLIVVDGNVFAAMCRCGASNSKPYCDGTHGKIGFKADPTEITVLEQLFSLSIEVLEENKQATYS